jgi:hypothetical protein
MREKFSHGLINYQYQGFLYFFETTNIKIFLESKMISRNNTQRQKFGYFTRIAVVAGFLGFASVASASIVEKVSGGGTLTSDFGDEIDFTEFQVRIDSEEPIWIDLKGASSTEENFNIIFSNNNGIKIDKFELKFINEGGVLPDPQFVFTQMYHTTPSVVFSLDPASTDGDIMINTNVTPGDPGAILVDMNVINFGAADGTWSLGFGINGADLNAVPLPAPIWLFGSSLIGLLAYRKKIEK